MCSTRNVQTGNGGSETLSLRSRTKKTRHLPLTIFELRSISNSRFRNKYREFRMTWEPLEKGGRNTKHTHKHTHIFIREYHATNEKRIRMTISPRKFASFTPRVFQYRNEWRDLITQNLINVLPFARTLSARKQRKSSSFALSLQTSRHTFDA